MINRCDESRDVADDSTANADEERLSVNPPQRSSGLQIAPACSSVFDFSPAGIVISVGRETCRHQTFPRRAWRKSGATLLSEMIAQVLRAKTLVHHAFPTWFSRSGADKYAINAAYQEKTVVLEARCSIASDPNGSRYIENVPAVPLGPKVTLFCMPVAEIRH